MTVKEYIKKNKLSQDTFIALYNKDDIWIICGLTTDPRLEEYKDLDIIEDTNYGNIEHNIVKIKTVYDKAMQLGYYRMIEERMEAVNKKKKK